MNTLTKLLTYPAPNKLLKLVTNYPGGTSVLTNQEGMLTELIPTIARTLQNITKLYSNELDDLTSVSVKKLKEKAGNTLFLAPTRKKMLLYSPRLCNTRLILTP
jgi:hypothetical protein